MWNSRLQGDMRKIIKQKVTTKPPRALRYYEDARIYDGKEETHKFMDQIDLQIMDMIDRIQAFRDEEGGNDCKPYKKI